MNVYDFDGTLYDGDSSIDFYKYCVRRFPVVLLEAPVQAAAALRYKLGRITKTQMKEVFYGYFRLVPDAAQLARDFWAGPGRAHLKAYYAEVHREDDCIASASPTFLLQPVCEMLGVTRLVATEVDPATGKHFSQNCRDVEKLRRVRLAFPGEVIKCAYSDSHADDPLAAAAQHAVWVRGEELSDWPV